MKPRKFLRSELPVVIGLCILLPLCLTGLMHFVVWLAN